MILLFGGVYQGKLSYGLERFGLTEDDVYRCSDEDTALPAGRRIIYEIDKWLLALLKAEASMMEVSTVEVSTVEVSTVEVSTVEVSTADALKRFIQANKDGIVICNDISCGVVPLDPVLRKWREAVGRSMAVLAQASDEVIRLFCGIPTRLC